MSTPFQHFQHLFTKDDLKNARADLVKDKANLESAKAEYHDVMNSPSSHGDAAERYMLAQAYSQTIQHYQVSVDRLSQLISRLEKQFGEDDPTSDAQPSAESHSQFRF